MADTKISALPSGAPAQAGDEYVIARSGANYKLTLTNIAASMPPIGATTPNTGAFTSLTNGLGAVGTPSYTFTGDANTGMWSPTADTVAWSTGGSERMRITSGGAVTVGRTATLYGETLSVAGFAVIGANSGGTGQVIIGNDGTTGINGTVDNVAYVFRTNNTERMRIDSSGNVGIGGTAPAFAKMLIGGTLPAGSANSQGIRMLATIPSGATSAHNSFFSAVSTEAASFTLTNLFHFNAEPQSFGAGSAVTNQYGFYAASSLTGATNNYGFYSNIASGSNRWNFYANGTAANYFAGNTLVGTTDAGQASGAGVKNLSSGACWVVQTAGDSFSAYNTTAAAYRFYVTSGGVINATNGTISVISDQRLKENVRDLDAGLAAIMALKPRKFDWKKGKGKNIKDDRGFIAQELEQVFPDLVDEWKDAAPKGEEPYKSVRADLIPVLVKAIQELAAKVAALEAK